VSDVLVGDVIKEFGERGLVFGEHAEKLDAIAELRVAGHDLRADEERVSCVEFNVEACADRKWVHAFDVASVEA
jgi:hypothetical protein